MMNQTLVFLTTLFLALFAHSQNNLPIDVWIDTDPSVGIKYRDVDDGLALIQAFHSPELNIIGISAVFGNATLDEAYPITQMMVQKFSKQEIPVYSGAANENDLGKDTDAVLQIVDALKKRPLTILALGPVTNIAAVIKNYPEASKNIKEIIAVAGRRPGQRFQTGTKNTKAHRDFNFEKDAEAFKILIGSDIPVTLAPFEISSQVWIKKEDIAKWHNGNVACKWLAPHAKEWLKLWEMVFFVDGFNPFDTLAIAYLTSPALIKHETLPVMIQILEDDVTEERMQGTKVSQKPYLLVSKDLESTRTVRYCYIPNEGFKQDLMARLLKEKSQK